MSVEDQSVNIVEIDSNDCVSNLGAIERFRRMKTPYIIVKSSDVKRKVEFTDLERIMSVGSNSDVRLIKSQGDGTRLLNETLYEKKLFCEFVPYASKVFDIITTVDASVCYRSSPPATYTDSSVELHPIKPKEESHVPLWNKSDRHNWIQSPISWICSLPSRRYNQKTNKPGQPQDAHVDSLPREFGGGPAISMILYLHQLSYLEGVVEGKKTRLVFFAGDIVLFWGHLFVHWGVGYLRANCRLFWYFDYVNNGRKAKDTYYNELSDLVNDLRCGKSKPCSMAEMDLIDSYANGRRLVSKRIMRDIVIPAKLLKRRLKMEHCEKMRAQKRVKNKY